jgi:hydroxylamine reductase
MLFLCNDTVKSRFINKQINVQIFPLKERSHLGLGRLLIHILRGIAYWANKGLVEGKVDWEAGLFICSALFSTVTNTNFDPVRFIGLIREGIQLRNRVRNSYCAHKSEPAPDSATWESDAVEAIQRKSLSMYSISSSPA